jgi:hypothetical protein
MNQSNQRPASFIIYALSGSNSVVECDLAKVEVAGSNPVSRSNFHLVGLSFCPLTGVSTGLSRSFSLGLLVCEESSQDFP